MDRIIIDVSKGELDFMREALQTKHINLMSYLDTCEANSIRKEVLNSLQPTWNEAADITEDDFDKELAKFSRPKKPFVYKKKTPYGVKKDGTPKAKPGRKS